MIFLWLHSRFLSIKCGTFFCCQVGENWVSSFQIFFIFPTHSKWCLDVCDAAGPLYTWVLRRFDFAHWEDAQQWMRRSQHISAVTAQAGHFYFRMFKSFICIWFYYPKGVLNYYSCLFIPLGSCAAGRPISIFIHGLYVLNAILVNLLFTFFKRLLIDSVYVCGAHHYLSYSLYTELVSNPKKLHVQQTTWIAGGFLCNLFPSCIIILTLVTV